MDIVKLKKNYLRYIGILAIICEYCVDIDKLHITFKDFFKEVNEYIDNINDYEPNMEKIIDISDDKLNIEINRLEKIVSIIKDIVDIDTDFWTEDELYRKVCLIRIQLGDLDTCTTLYIPPHPPIWNV